MDSFSLAMAFIMGLTGSLHCAGMCGPIMLVLPFQSFRRPKRLAALSLYHLGRISVYALFGWLIYIFKSSFNPAWQQQVSMVFGIALLLIGILSFLSSGKLHLLNPFTTWVKSGLTHFVGRPSLSALFMTGILNGLLPCGLVYMALSLSVAAPTAFFSILYMYVFGLGTVPVLVAIVILKSRVRLFSHFNVKRLVPVLMLFFGCLFMLRGMNLGIPYLSPKIEMESNLVKASCCHKPTK